MALLLVGRFLWPHSTKLTLGMVQGGAQRLFFEPTRDGVTRHAESAGQTAQARALLIGAQDEFALFF
jgi:hypothetical protein